MNFKNFYNTVKLIEALQLSKQRYPKTPEEWIEKINNKLTLLRNLYKISTPSKLKDSLFPASLIVKSNLEPHHKLSFKSLESMIAKPKYNLEDIHTINLNTAGVAGYLISDKIIEDLSSPGGMIMHGFAWNKTGKWFLIKTYLHVNYATAPPSETITDFLIGSFGMTSISLEDLVQGKWRENYSQATMAETIFFTISEYILMTRERVQRQVDKFDETANIILPEDLGFYYGESSAIYKSTFERLYKQS